MRVVCSCSSCSCSLSETEILSGWMEGDNDTQVPCPVCRKLTPVFLIFERIRKTSSWHSSLVLPSLKYGEQIYLLRPDHFREELEVQLESRKGRIWKSKESFVKNQTTLFWNAMWYFSNLDLPFERAELNRVLMTYEDSMSKGSDFFSSPFFSFFLSFSSNPFHSNSRHSLDPEQPKVSLPETATDYACSKRSQAGRLQQDLPNL